MKNLSIRQKAYKVTREKRVKRFKKIYIQEFMRNIRPEVIIEAISEKYLIPEQTIRDYIKPARLKKGIEAGEHSLDENYKSIL